MAGDAEDDEYDWAGSYYLMRVREHDHRAEEGDDWTGSYLLLTWSDDETILTAAEGGGTAAEAARAEPSFETSTVSTVVPVESSRHESDHVPPEQMRPAPPVPFPDEAENGEAPPERTPPHETLLLSPPVPDDEMWPDEAEDDGAPLQETLPNHKALLLPPPSGVLDTPASGGLVDGNDPPAPARKVSAASREVASAGVRHLTAFLVATTVTLVVFLAAFVTYTRRRVLRRMGDEAAAKKMKEKRKRRRRRRRKRRTGEKEEENSGVIDIESQTSQDPTSTGSAGFSETEGDGYVFDYSREEESLVGVLT